MGGIDWNSISHTIALPSLTLLGCAAAYIFADQKGMRSARAFLEKFFPQRPDYFYYRVDFFLSATVGTAIGIALYAPLLSMHQAIAAGVGWTAFFSIVTVPRTMANRSKTDPNSQNSERQNNEPGAL